MRTLVLLFSLLLPTTVLAEREIIVDFSDATLTIQEQGSIFMSTAVVLPKNAGYSLPVSGSVNRAVMGPWWTPTDNMHRMWPGRYKKTYRPYESGNAMGHCKIYINFDQPRRSLTSVRIHGNAQPADLGRRLSLGCIRIPDSLCATLVELSRPGDRIYFVQ